jgi:anti-sigma factor RsiW
MDCSNVRPLLSHHVSGRLDEARTSEVARHLEGCPSCRQLALVEGALDGALATLPRGAAPARLLARLGGLVLDGDAPAGTATGAPSPPPPLPQPRPGDRPRGTESRDRARASTWTAAFVSACAAAALVLVVVRTSAPSSALSRGPDLVAEAVNDHLRVVASTHPVEIESGGIHQVKPWFTGRIDFAPRVTFSGDDDFPLRGGSVGYFIDRKAAVFLFQRRLHAITLLVFPPDGLAWPSATGAPVGRLSVTQTTSRGFSVLLWRDGGLGYVLVSDVNAHELVTLATKLND